MTESFRDAVVALIPQLRAYATALVRSSVEADDLVQDTLLRAWNARVSFQPGTNLKAWLYKILRNTLYTSSTRQRRMVPDVDGRLAASLVSAADQNWRLEYNELRAAIDALGADTRDAVLLVHYAGLSYEEAAQISGCAVGTMKSRVHRACQKLSRLLDEPPQTDARTISAQSRRRAPESASFRAEGPAPPPLAPLQPENADDLLLRTGPEGRLARGLDDRDALDVPRLGPGDLRPASPH